MSTCCLAIQDRFQTRPRRLSYQADILARNQILNNVTTTVAELAGMLSVEGIVLGHSEQAGTSIALHKFLASTPPCCGSRSALADLLMNLIANAAEAMPEGGDLTLKTWDEPGWCCLSVADTGGGGPDEVRQHAVDPFSTTKGPQSAGLGLTTEQAVARAAGDELFLESQPRGGTTITVRLPIATETEQPDPPMTDSLRQDVGSLQVLVVDDDPVVLDVLGDVLALLGHAPITAASGAQVLQAAHEAQPDLVITDLGMPEMTGTQLAEALKSQRGDLPVILLTGWGDSLVAGEQDEALDRIVAKPVTVDGLREAIAAVMANREALGANR